MMPQLKDMTDETRIVAFGYDPLARLKFIGDTKEKFPYLHPGDRTIYSSRFAFSYNRESGDIDVSHSGLNGRVFTGKVLPDGTIIFTPPHMDTLMPKRLLGSLGYCAIHC